MNALELVAEPVRILLVEDNPGDVRLTRETLRECKVRNELLVVGDGAEALVYLWREHHHTHAPRPDLVLLDLNLPSIDGPLLTRALRYAIERQGMLDQLRTLLDQLERANIDLRVAYARELDAVRQLRQVDHLKDQLIAVVSHELRAPLTSICGITATMDRRWATLSDAQKCEFDCNLVDKGQRLSRLVANLLTRARITAGAVDVRPRRINIRMAIRRTVGNIDIENVVIHCDSGLEAEIDPDLFEQMLTNYLSNAVRYGHPPIVIDVDRDTTSFEVRVRDGGGGVPIELVPHLLNEFAQTPG